MVREGDSRRINREVNDTSFVLVIHMETNVIARIGGIYSNFNHLTSESMVVNELANVYRMTVGMNY